MKKILLAVALLMGSWSALFADASALVFDTSRSDIPAIELTDRAFDGECAIRGGLPHAMNLLQAGKPVTVAFIGGSITQGGFCYRLQLAKWLEQRYPEVKFTWINAGVSGTGTDLGAFRVEEQVLSGNPDLVFIEFSANGGYAPAMEGIIRKIHAHNPATDICLLYSATEPHMRQYQKGETADVIKGQEALAEHYGLPSVHMARRAAALEAEGKLMWKGPKDAPEGTVVFSTDGLHPAKAGGNLYAQAVARSLDKIATAPATARKAFQEPVFGTEWDNANMYDPAEVCKRHGLWKDVEAAKDTRMKKFADWFPSVLTSSHPNSTLSFAFEGDMFGLFDLGGPEMGQLEVYIDGQMVRLKSAKDGSLQYNEATALTGTHYLNRFNRHCNNRYRGQHVLVKVEPGLHQVTLKVSENKADKKKILGEKQLADITANPDRYDKTYLMLGRLLVRGTIAECKPVKGLPKMKQQLKWEKKINDYMERDAEQAAWPDATLVVGSSSIDMWKSLEEDFADRHVIRRGVSGTKAIDLYNYREQLIAPFNPKRIIIYEGDNEIGFKWEVDEMMESMKRLFHEIRRMKPDAEIYMVSVKPSPVRAKSLPKIQQVNALIKEFVESQPRAGYIDIHTPMLNADGSVRPELFLGDGLHPAKEGYDIWREQFGKVINK
ncbi:MAG: SGNH/GDSL hydrolase family protein [Muribaculaceae bacterium]|nr:SGNH/GDSL hydrolase family protein [Muribaculaceae bacterium]